MKKTILFLVMAVALTTQILFAQVPSNVPTSGLLAYYPFNGNANDESGNGNNGTVMNGATLTTDRNGNANSAYNFDGVDDFIEIANTLLPNVNTSFSVSFWFNTNLNTVQAIISESSPIPNNTNYKYAINFSTILNVGTSNGISSNGVQSQSQIITGQWIFGTMVYNSSAQNIKVYFNGIEEGVISNSIYSNQNNATQIGRGIAGGSGIPGAYMSGKIDDIGIWNRAISQQEITNMYNSLTSNECLTMVINTGVLSTNPVTYNSTVNIYPNPANDHITIDCGNLANVVGWNIKITNMLGQEVFNQPMNTQQYVVPLNSWTGQGMYFVKIINAQNEVVNIKKIILQ